MDDDELRKLIRETREHIDNIAADVRHEIRSGDEETRRHMDVLAEHFDHKFDAVGEGLQWTNERIDRVEARLDKKIDEVGADLAGRIDFVAHDLRERIGRR